MNERACPSPARPVSGSLSRDISGAAWLRVAWICALLGVVLRLVHYLRDPSVWHDEAALVVNVLEKGWIELLGPLRFGEAAPPLFLWIERAMAAWFGDGTYVLRLIPAAAGVAALVLVFQTSRSLLAPRGAAAAVAAFAGSERLLWHGCEAKPYAVDVLIAAAAIAYWLRSSHQELGRRAMMLALLAPAAIWISYPACFVVGGLLAAMALECRRPRDAAAVLLLTVVVVVSFGGLALGPAAAQRCADMDACWTHAFPDWSSPGTVPLWSLIRSIEVVDYAVRPIGGALAIAALVGAASIARRATPAAIVLFTPIALAWCAACLGRYPYGGARVMAFAAPAICLAAGEGLSVAASRFKPRSLAWAVVGAAALVPLAWGIWRTVEPWRRIDGKGAAMLVREDLASGDAVRANNWESLYYFRDLGSRFEPLSGELPTDATRVWIILTSQTPGERERMARDFDRPGWRLARRADRTHATVLLLVREPVPERVARRQGG